MPPPVTPLPAATIQDDFTTVLSEVHAGIVPSENVWLSCYKDGEPSVHGNIAVSLHERDRDRVELVGTGGVELRRTSQVSALFFFFFWGGGPGKLSFIHFFIPSLVPPENFYVSGPNNFLGGQPSSRTPLVVWESESTRWISSLRPRFTRILRIRTRNV
jgi:hypothetical protein